MNDKKLIIKLGKRIRSFRIKDGMTQRQFSIECSFDTPFLSKLESGKSNPTMSTLVKVCKVLDIEIVELFKD